MFIKNKFSIEIDVYTHFEFFSQQTLKSNVKSILEGELKQFMRIRIEFPYLYSYFHIEKRISSPHALDNLLIKKIKRNET